MGIAAAERDPRKKSLPPPAELKEFLEKAGLKPRRLLLPISLAAAGAGFEGLSLSLLVPLAQGIMTMDFSSARRYAVVEGALKVLPSSIPLYPKGLFSILLVLIFLSSVLKNALQCGSYMSFAYIVRNLANDLRKLIFSRYLTFGKLYFDRTNAGYLQGALMNFTYTIAYRLMDLQQIFAWLFMLVVYLALMLSISWKLTLLIALIFPLLNYSLKWLIERIKRTSRDHADAQSELSKRVFNILSCLPVVKSYSREEEERSRFASESDSVRIYEFSIDKKQIVVNPIQETIVLAVLLLLIAAMAFITVKGGPGRLSGLLVYFYLIKRSTLAFGVLNSMKASFATVSGPIAGVLEILRDEGKFFVPDGAMEVEQFKRGIEFRDLSYAFNDEVPVLRSVSFSVEKGGMTALVGPSGAGKSTLINLLMRFYDGPPGAIQLDGTDIRELTLKSLHRRMALVSQDAMLFNDTLRANIAYGLDGAVSDEKLLEAVRKARLHDFVSRLPQGLSTFVGDRGVQLSGGEKQRVAIARAMLKEADILILDEATSALDSATEKLIQEAIDEMIAGKTAIVIAHRLSTIKKADKIVAIEEGRVAEYGTLDELLRKRGRFYQYWEAQKFF